jgi:hypothetical protein
LNSLILLYDEKTHEKDSEYKETAKYGKEEKIMKVEHEIQKKEK